MISLETEKRESLDFRNEKSFVKLSKREIFIFQFQKCMYQRRREEEEEKIENVKRGGKIINLIQIHMSNMKKSNCSAFSIFLFARSREKEENLLKILFILFRDAHVCK